jgi:hypothetical protein
MAIQVLEVHSVSDRRRFIRLPYEIHKGHAHWLPNMLSDEQFFYDPEKNPSFHGCDTFMALAIKDGRATGRIMGIINHAYNKKNGQKDARFFALDTYEDSETVHALLEYAETWARKAGCTHMVGPYGFSDKDPQGYLIEGFEHPPMIVSACNFPYQVHLLEAEGFTKEVDCMTFLFDVTAPLDPVYERIGERYSRREGMQMVEFSSRKQMRPYIVPIFNLVNETYADIYGFVPMKEEEMYAFAGRYMPVLAPEFVKVVLVRGQVAAFLLGIPCLTRGIQRSGGRLWPFGFLHILQAFRTTRKLDLMLGGVKNCYRGMGFEVLMALKLLESLQRADYHTIEIHLVLETNAPMLAEMERAGAKMHKKFRVFRKELMP